MKTHIIKTNKGRAGWSDMYCGLVGWMDNDNSEHFVSGSANTFAAIDHDNPKLYTDAFCNRCWKIAIGV